MSKKATQYISILASSEEVQATETMNAFPSPKKVLAKSRQIAVDKFEKSLAEFLQTLGTIVEKLPKSTGTYNIDTLAFSMSVDGGGKISLVGEISTGFTSSMTVTFKISSTDKE